jgi:hypothetical protein
MTTAKIHIMAVVVAELVDRAGRRRIAIKEYQLVVVLVPQVIF